MLTGPDGGPLSPDELVAAPVALDAASLEALGRGAAHQGAVLYREGREVVALGEAAVLALPEGLGAKGAAARAEELLGAIASADGGRPLALGALPFSPARRGRLLLPRLWARRSGSEVEVGAIFRRGAAPARLSELLGPEPGGPPEAFSLEPPESHGAFVERIAAAIAAIEAGRLDKVVLAREVTVTADRDYSPAHLLPRLRQLHPSCFSFSVDGIVGASPELLCRVEGGRVTSQPLAGTAPRSGDPERDRQLEAALSASEKERAEHGFVVEAIRSGLAPYVTDERAGPPHLLELRNVVHLATTITATLRPGAAGCLELVAALHPTPAVGGVPAEAALEYLELNEPLVRDRYAGPVGYLDADGDGEFWLAIRSAMLEGRRARLLAGVGIVEGSEPEAELAETQLKLQAVLAAAVRP